MSAAPACRCPARRGLRLGSLLLAMLAGLLSACATRPPADVDQLCAIFDDKKKWFKRARSSEQTWGTPIPVLMAIVHQESRFVARARPPRRRILGVIPGRRPSNAYGYSQALESTWQDYQRSAGRYGADRDNFGDAIDFVGWYSHQSHRRNGIARNDAYRLYLAYHEGHGGYRRGSYRDKGWLRAVARKVADRALRYQRQLASCRERLEKKRGWFRRRAPRA